MTTRWMTSATVIAVLASSIASAAGLIVYPANRQSPQLQQRDEGECYVWARNQTGLDPAAGIRTAAPPPPQQDGQMGRSLAGGALLGGGIGAISGHGGEGAAVGLLFGAIRGVAREKQQAAQQAQQAQQYQAGALQQFNNAQAACLQGRGYTVR